MTSCASVKTEYIYVTTDVVFPIFPDPTDNVTLNQDTDTVSMPLEYYIRIAEYKRDVDKVRAQIKRINNLYNNGGNDETDAGKAKK